MVGEKWSEWDAQPDVDDTDSLPMLHGGTDNARIPATLLRGTLGAGPIFIAGHSWNAPTDDVFGGYTGADYPAHDAVAWPFVFGDMVGAQPTFLAVPIRSQAASGANAEQYTQIPVPRDGIVEHVAYYPNDAITPDDTHHFIHRLQTYSHNNGSFVESRYTVTEKGAGPLGAGVAVNEFMLQAGNEGAKNLCALYIDETYQDAAFVNVRGGSCLRYVQLQQGANGLLDPGGTLVIRLGSKLRNAAMFNTRLCTSGVNKGGWATAFAQMPHADLQAVHVYATATAAQNATQISVASCPQTILASLTVRFANGVVATLTDTLDPGETTMYVSALSGEVPQGTEGVYHYQNNASNGMVPNAVSVFNWGIVDAAETTPDWSAWRECLRAVVARALCTEVNLNGPQSNVLRVNGDGGGTWALTPTQPGGGQWNGNAYFFQGAVGTATKTTFTVSIDESYDGDHIDLFFYAIASPSGQNRGGVAKIFLDGTEVATVDTSAVAQSCNTKTIACTTNGTTTLTRTSGPSFDERHDRGKALFSSGGTTAIAAGAIISSVTDGDHAVMSAAAGTGSGNVEVDGFIPMVKRIPAAAGGHTLRIEMVSMAQTTNRLARFYVAGYGIEANNPTAGVLVGDCARVPNTGYDDADANTLNDNTDDVLAGTATHLALVGSNTQEPALPSSVILVEVDAAIAKATTYFKDDGLHLNRRGQGKLADEMYRALAKLARLQAVAR